MHGFLLTVISNVSEAAKLPVFHKSSDLHAAYHYHEGEAIVTDFYDRKDMPKT